MDLATEDLILFSKSSIFSDFPKAWYARSIWVFALHSSKNGWNELQWWYTIQLWGRNTILIFHPSLLERGKGGLFSRAQLLVIRQHSLTHSSIHPSIWLLYSEKRFHWTIWIWFYIAIGALNILDITAQTAKVFIYNISDFFVLR